MGIQWGPSPPQQPLPTFGPCLLWQNGRPSQQLLSSCSTIISTSVSAQRVFSNPVGTEIFGDRKLECLRGYYGRSMPACDGRTQDYSVYGAVTPASADNGNGLVCPASCVHLSLPACDVGVSCMVNRLSWFSPEQR